MAEGRIEEQAVRRQAEIGNRQQEWKWRQAELKKTGSKNGGRAKVENMHQGLRRE